MINVIQRVAFQLRILYNITTDFSSISFSENELLHTETIFIDRNATVLW